MSLLPIKGDDTSLRYSTFFVAIRKHLFSSKSKKFPDRLMSKFMAILPKMEKRGTCWRHCYWILKYPGFNPTLCMSLGSTKTSK